MKNLFFLLILSLLLAACQKSKNNNFSVYVSNDADSITLAAAGEFESYWQKLTNLKPAVNDNSNNAGKKLFIGRNFLNDSISEILNNIHRDGFIIIIKSDSVFLAGKNPIGDMYAVSTFLEDFYGITMVDVNHDYIPENVNDIPEYFYKIYTPAFDYRHVHSLPKVAGKYQHWHKLNDMSIFGMFVHTFNKLIPPDKYFDEHPEYFSLINGKRRKDAQLCLSNSEVVDLITKLIGEGIKEHPDKMYWSVSQNDTYYPCQCESCKALYKKYGSVSGAYVALANHVAEKYPDYQISTLAYQFTRKAPTNIKPLPNVNIKLCTIECNRSKPLEDIEGNHTFAMDMKEWSKLTNNIFLWDYVVQFRTYLCPFPNFPVLQPNIKFFKKYNANMMFQQASGGKWSDLIELKQYLIAKLLWNPDADVDSLARNFITIYYGKAAPYVQKYYNTMNQKMIEDKDKQNLGIYGIPGIYISSFLSPDLMNKYESWMDSAEAAVAGDSLYLDRVKHTRLSVDFAWFDIACSNSLDQMPAVIDSAGHKIINPKLLKLRDKIMEMAEKDSRISIGEHTYDFDSYFESNFRALNYRLMSNIIKDADIKILTEYSNKYDVGGAKALNNGLFGGNNFLQNWLGFQDEDMVTVIDLKSEKEFSNVYVNFLDDNSSWIFIPEKIIVEVSDDGKNFREIASKSNSIKKHENFYDTKKSIPFEFHFPVTKARYIKITANSIKECPAWHPAAGGKSWIFIDEIIVN
jgi:hypothetical protein